MTLDATTAAGLAAATGSTKKTVRTPSALVAEMEKCRELPRTLMGGTDAMRKAGEKYLPKEQGESADAYRIRLSRTTLFNAFRKTVKDMAGKVFAKHIALGEDMPEQVKEWCENIDLTGRNLTNFAFDVFVDGIQNGITYIMGEMPPKMQEGATLADEKAAGRRPYLCHVKTCDLIGWKSALIGGRETLTQVRVLESEKVAGEYEDATVEQVRVIEPGKVRLYRKVKDKDEWIQEGDDIVVDLSYIPLRPIYFNRTAFMMGEPPLTDLADLNVAHWQSQSDQRNILHVARVPILFGSGLDDPAEGKTVTVSAGAMFRASSPDAKLSFVEHSGQAIGAGDTDLKNLEVQMQAMGLQLLISTPGQTATGEIRDDVKENSPLSMMAMALQDGLEEGIGWLAEFAKLGEEAGGSITVNRDFGISSRDQADLTLLLAAFQNSAITHETFIRELQRRGVLSEEIDPEEEAEALALLDMTDTSNAKPVQPDENDQGSGEDDEGAKAA